MKAKRAKRNRILVELAISVVVNVISILYMLITGISIVPAIVWLVSEMHVILFVYANTIYKYLSEDQRERSSDILEKIVVGLTGVVGLYFGYRFVIGDMGIAALVDIVIAGLTLAGVGSYVLDIVTAKDTDKYLAEQCGLAVDNDPSDKE